MESRRQPVERSNLIPGPPPPPLAPSQAILKSQEQQAAETATTLEKEARSLPGVERLQLEAQASLQRSPDDGFLWYLYALHPAASGTRGM